jgi:hypothetical protein
MAMLVNKQEANWFVNYNNLQRNSVITNSVVNEHSVITNIF